MPLTSTAGAADEHPLLAAWGQAGREQRTLLLKGNVADVDAMVEINPETTTMTLLRALQYELLELVVPPQPPHQTARWGLLNPEITLSRCMLATVHTVRLNCCRIPYSGCYKRLS